ncbi:MAG: peptidoglycan-binding domain-containing protein [Xanthobacteraceae bacterium]
MRERRNDRSRTNARAGTLAVAFGTRLWMQAIGRPVDSFAILGATAATILIVVNAVFLQSGARPAPFVANPTVQKTAEAAPKPAEQTGPRVIDMSATHSVARPPQTVPMPVPSPRRNDPIADLIGPSPRILAVQRVLSNYGYGQIKPNGMLDDATSGAIEKFEREHKLPVSGRVSDRLVSELAAMTGHPIE